MGTSLQVHPFASLIDVVGPKVPRLLINRDKVGDHGSKHKGFDFSGSRQKYFRDAVYLGNCDDGCVAFAELMGWKEELTGLVEEGRRMKTTTATKMETADSSSQVVPGCLSEQPGQVVKPLQQKGGNEQGEAPSRQESSGPVKPAIATNDNNNNLEICGKNNDKNINGGDENDCEVERVGNPSVDDLTQQFSKSSI